MDKFSTYSCAKGQYNTQAALTLLGTFVRYCAIFHCTKYDAKLDLVAGFWLSLELN